MLLAGRLLGREPLQRAGVRRRLVVHDDLELSLGSERARQRDVQRVRELVELDDVELGLASVDVHAANREVACVEHDFREAVDERLHVQHDVAEQRRFGEIHAPRDFLGALRKNTRKTC